MQYDLGMRIPLQRGLFTLVSVRDYAIVSRYKWYASKDHKGNFYVRETASDCYLHRFILGPQPQEKVDHRNHDGLDNRRCNIRVCTQAQNLRNKRGDPGKSGFRGVHYHRRDNLWHARISVGNKNVGLGYYKDKLDAARAYDRAALKLSGEFAILNFPEEVGYRR